VREYPSSAKKGQRSPMSKQKSPSNIQTALNLGRASLGNDDLYEARGGSPMRLSPRRGNSLESYKTSPLKRSIPNDQEIKKQITRSPSQKFEPRQQ